jgi:CHAD domain-containing protein
MAKRYLKGEFCPRDTVAYAMEVTLPPKVEGIVGYETLARAGNVDGVHDMRVATKRLREAARVFRCAWGRKRSARYLEHLERLNDALGAGRELDVLAGQLRDLMARCEDLTEPLQPLLGHIQEQRSAADGLLIPALDEALPCLREDFGHLLQERPARLARVWEMRVGRLGRREVSRRAKAAFALEKAATAPDAPAELHRMRIAIKRVKYALEVFLPVLPQGAVEAYKPISDLQELMGLVHDTDVMTGVLREHAGGLLATDAAECALDLAAAERAERHTQTLALLAHIHKKRFPRTLGRL